MTELEFLSPDQARPTESFQPLLKSSLERRLREAGAEFEEREGWLVAVSVPGAAQRSPRIRDITHTAKIEVRGGVNGLELEGAEVVAITPERTLVLTDYRRGAALRAELREQFRTVVDMSAALAGLEIAGSGARTVMARLTDLDLEALPAAGSVSHVPAVVLRDGDESFRIFFPQEYGHYLWEAAVDAAEPLGGGPTP